MRRSVATVCLSGTLEEKLAAASQVGFDGVEVFAPDVVSCPLTPAQIRRRAADLGLTLELYQPLRDLEAVAEATFAANLRRARASFEIAAELGIDTVLACSNVSADAVDDDALAAHQLRQVGELAAGYGVRVAYEALAWGRHVHTFTHSWKIVDEANHPNLGLCLDSFHILARGDDPSAIRAIPAEKLFFVQLSDAPSMSLDVLELSRHYRCFPGQGSFDLAGFVAEVIRAGYRGPLSLEVFSDVFRQADAERTATDALRSLIALEEALAPRIVAPVADLRLAQPTPVSDPMGYSFVEIAVNPFTELASAALLEAMGFHRVGQHRSKPVQMWQQGGARILLNRGRQGRQDWLRAEAAVSAFAVEVADPRRCAQRAQALLAPAIPRRYGPGEADLFATESPDGTSVFFCRSDADPASWLGDFEPVGEAGGASCVDRIDYVALSQAADDIDEAVLFYESVVGLRRRPPEDVAAPRGLVRARAVSSADAAVRLLLNVPALAGPGRSAAEIQHVAFACSDVRAAARRMRELGLPILTIPDNYYRDLAARCTLSPREIDDLRQLSICYDSDGRGGEYLHFSTAMLGRRLFFEIVQRVNGYEGFGTVNTPVRMAAQYRRAALAPVTG